MSFGFGLCIILSLVSQLLHRKLRCGCIFYYVHFHFLFHFILILLCVALYVCLTMGAGATWTTVWDAEAL